MAYSDVVLADTPLAYYRLGEASGTTLVDSSGNGRDGTYAGSPALGAAPLLFGATDKAVTFDGVNDNGTVPSAAWMAPSAFTAEAWIKPSTVAAGARTIVARNGAAGVWMLRVDGAKVSAYVVSGGFKLAQSTTSLVAGNTYHVAMTYDGTTIRVYVNGVLEASTAASPITTNTAPLSIGSNSLATPSEYFTGVIDEVALYGTALSATRLQAHYAEGAGTVPAPFVSAAVAPSGVPLGLPYVTAVLTDAPAAYWRLSEGSGTVMVDSSGNSRSGTYTNSPSPTTSLLPSGEDSARLFAPSFSIDQYGDVPQAAWMNFGSAFTAEVWVNFTTVARPQVIVARDNLGADSTARSWRLDLTNGAFLASVFRGNGFVAATGPTVVAGTTYHVVMTYDGANVRLYVNGAQAATAAATGTLNNPAYGITVGKANYTSPNEPYSVDGRIDEVAVYPTALSATRIAAHYTAAQKPSQILMTGEAFAATSAANDGTAVVPVRILGETFVAPATAADGFVVGKPLVVTSTGAWTSQWLTVEGLVAGEPWVQQGEAFVSRAIALTLQTLVGTDTTYSNEGYTYDGTALVEYDPPVAPVPPSVTRADVRRVHVHMPAPTLVKGRPQ